MEITNKERREVAGRIRERIWRNRRTAWDVVLASSCVDVFGDRFRMNKEFTLFLADLIDRPTCKPKERYTGYVDAVCDSFCCPKCGFEIDVHIGEEQHQTETAKYCPNCGEGVTDED